MEDDKIFIITSDNDVIKIKADCFTIASRIYYFYKDDTLVACFDANHVSVIRKDVLNHDAD